MPAAGNAAAPVRLAAADTRRRWQAKMVPLRICLPIIPEG